MGKDNLSFFPELNLYSLNNPGIPFLTQGEKPVLTDLARKKLTGKIGAVERGRFSAWPISNLAFHQSESTEWQNGSWIMDVDGFDQKMFDFLSQPQAATVRLLPLVQELAELSGSSGQMAEIGFNVGGGEIVFKRILLPGNYQPPADQPIEPLVYQGSKMPNVFVEAWDKLKVGDYDQGWDERVREQLAGNSRDMDKRIVYQMINGEKWVEWNGVKMWAGLLSDRRDIGRFLAEESALATLKPGEFMVAKYSHGSGGAISAATAQQRKTEKPEIVGDVQMMGKNGIIYQAAVEGEIDQIDVLINGLVDQLHSDHNLPLPETIIPLKPWLAALPILPMEMYPIKFLLESQAAVELKPMVIRAVSVAEPPMISAIDLRADNPGFIDFELGFNVDDESFDNAFSDWQEPDHGSEWDGGDDGPSRPEEPVPGGGLGIIPTKTVFVASKTVEPKVVVKKPDFEEPVNFSYSDRYTKTLPLSLETKTPTPIYAPVVTKEQPTILYVSRPHSATIRPSGFHPEGQKQEGVVYQKAPVVLPPLWQVKLEPLNDKEIPVWQMNFAADEDLTTFVLTMFFLIMNTKRLQHEVTLKDFRGSGEAQSRAAAALS